MRYKKALGAKGAASKMAQAKGTMVSTIQSICRNERNKQISLNIGRVLEMFLGVF